MNETILVIDDDEMNREVLEAFLSLENYEVLTAHNAKIGLEQADAHAPDLIILDVRLPDRSGYEVCRQLKQGDRTRHIPIMMITGYDLEDEASNLKQAGADDFLARPFEAENLLQHVKSLLG